MPAPISLELLRALKEVRFQARLLLMPGMWKKSPGGDQYTYEGPMNSVDDLEAAVDICEAIMIDEGVDHDD